MNGVMPEIGRCVDCGKPVEQIKAEQGRVRSFSVSAGGILCDNCVIQEKSAGETLIFSPDFDIVDVLAYFVDHPLSVFERIGLKPAVEAELRQILSEYLRSRWKEVLM